MAEVEKEGTKWGKIKGKSGGGKQEIYGEKRGERGKNTKTLVGEILGA